MCYSSSKDFGWSIRKETDSEAKPQQETPVETPEKPARAQDFTFWAFPGWRKTRTPDAPSAEKSKERV
ncbi:hypothetical protein CXX84_12255 [Arthrobacter sp. AFG7.2]|nr:hypothetical protein CXX84_12255 [Arthrobacter sp. AFG7.2]